MKDELMKQYRDKFTVPDDAAKNKVQDFCKKKCEEWIDFMKGIEGVKAACEKVTAKDTQNGFVDPKGCTKMVLECAKSLSNVDLSATRRLDAGKPAPTADAVTSTQTRRTSFSGR